MSHFTHVATKIKDKALLIESLKELGFNALEAREGAELPLFNYRGQITSNAHISVSRDQIHGLANDLGFRLVDDCYKVIISEWDSAHGKGKPGQGLGPGFVNQLMATYARKLVGQIVEQRVAQGAVVTARETLPDGTIKVRMTLPKTNQRIGARR